MWVKENKNLLFIKNSYLTYLYPAVEIHNLTYRSKSSLKELFSNFFLVSLLFYLSILAHSYWHKPFSFSSLSFIMFSPILCFNTYRYGVWDNHHRWQKRTLEAKRIKVCGDLGLGIEGLEVRVLSSGLLSVHN